MGEIGRLTSFNGLEEVLLDVVERLRESTVFFRSIDVEFEGFEMDESLFAVLVLLPGILFLNFSKKGRRVPIGELADIVSEVLYFTDSGGIGADGVRLRGDGVLVTMDCVATSD